MSIPTPEGLCAARMGRVLNGLSQGVKTVDVKDLAEAAGGEFIHGAGPFGFWILLEEMFCRADSLRQSIVSAAEDKTWGAERADAAFAALSANPSFLRAFAREQADSLFPDKHPAALDTRSPLWVALSLLALRDGLPETDENGLPARSKAFVRSLRLVADDSVFRRECVRMERVADIAGELGWGRLLSREDQRDIFDAWMENAEQDDTIADEARDNAEVQLGALARNGLVSPLDFEPAFSRLAADDEARSSISAGIMLALLRRLPDAGVSSERQKRAWREARAAAAERIESASYWCFDPKGAWGAVRDQALAVEEARMIAGVVASAAPVAPDPAGLAKSSEPAPRRPRSL
jgi:hypothetical protein